MKGKQKREQMRQKASELRKPEIELEIECPWIEPVVSFPTQDDKAVTELRQLRNASCGFFQRMGYGLGELMRLLALGKPCVR
jgi:hypothetical protein